VSSLHQAWEQIPLDGELCTISATEVKELTGLEPRLMMKWDHSSKLPPALRRTGRFILPLKNGHYAIVRGQGYHQPEPCPAPIDFPRRNTFRLETSESGVSEMQHLDLAYNTGLFSDFTGEPILYPTLRGRKYSPAFSFAVGRHILDVESVQIEIDQGYEGPDCIIVVEAKIGEPEDFHLRQIYYPFRAWMTRSEKRVRPVFFTFEPSSGLYRFREYTFDPADIYQAPRLVKVASYRLVAARASGVRQVVPVKKTAPIPQADKLARIAEVPVLVALGYKTPKTLAERLGFDPRQGAYYLDAACSVGLLERGPYRLSELGQEYVAKPALRESLLARSVLGVPLIQELLVSLMLAPGGRLLKDELVAIMRRSTDLGESTALRRARTLWAWLSWVAERGGNFRVTGEEIALTNGGAQLPLF
jgi:hypothetical protein